MLFLANLVTVAFILQTLTLGQIDIWEEPSQASISLGGVLIWHAAACVYMFICGRNGYKLILRMYVFRRRPDTFARYEHWGMEREVFGESTLAVWLVFGTVLGSLTIGGIFWFIAPATTPIAIEQTTVALYLAIFFGMPAYGGMLDYRNAETKRERLDALHPAFHARFPVSEILSMYECLRLASPVLWHEYTRLPEGQINKATNQEFRNRASSFHLRESQVNQRLMLIVGVVAVAAILPSLTFLVLEGTLTDWLRDLFAAPATP